MATKFQCDFCKKLFTKPEEVQGLIKFRTAMDEGVASHTKSDGTRLHVTVTNEAGGYIDCCFDCRIHLMKNAALVYSLA